MRPRLPDVDAESLMQPTELPPTLPLGEPPHEAPRGVMARIRNYFLTGLIGRADCHHLLSDLVVCHLG